MARNAKMVAVEKGISNLLISSEMSSMVWGWFGDRADVEFSVGEEAGGFARNMFLQVVLVIVAGRNDCEMLSKL